MGDLIRAEKAERAEVAEKQYRDKGRKGRCFDLPSLILVLQLSNQGGRDKKAEGKGGRVFFFFIKIENFRNCW